MWNFLLFFFPLWNKREYSRPSEIKFGLIIEFLNIILLIPVLWNHGTAMSLSQQCVLVAKETHPGVQEQSSARAQGGHPAPLLYPAEASPGIFCPPSVPQYMELLERVQQEISEMNNGVEHLSYVERLRELGVFSQDKRWGVGGVLIPGSQCVQGFKGVICVWGSKIWPKT